MSFPSGTGGLLRPPLTCSTNASLRIRQAAGRVLVGPTPFGPGHAVIRPHSSAAARGTRDSAADSVRGGRATRYCLPWPMHGRYDDGRTGPMSHVRRFDHVGLTVADLDVVTAFFVALGLEVEGRTFV